MVARRDPLSPFWANEGFFRTKPVMEMWLQAAFFRATEVDCTSGNMLRGSASAVAAPEWAARAPNAALAIVGGVMLSAGVARAYGSRAGLFAQVTLATTAHYALLGHQSTTDMPLVASISASFGALSAAISSASTPASAPRNVRLFGVALPATPSAALMVLFVVLLVPELARCSCHEM
jgi:4-amino-4-deoxy-L-arabinose transferase-like glycosyltransferase